LPRTSRAALKKVFLVLFLQKKNPSFLLPPALQNPNKHLNPTVLLTAIRRCIIRDRQIGAERAHVCDLQAAWRRRRAAA
jgi:hypothetical protein